jgi:hypothetical protein
MDMLTERDITLKRQHVFELDREKMNYEETTSKQYEVGEVKNIQLYYLYYQ